MTWAMVRAARFADEKGILPNGNGTLNETQSFLEACDLIWRDQAEYRLRAMKRQ